MNERIITIQNTAVHAAKFWRAKAQLLLKVSCGLLATTLVFATTTTLMAVTLQSRWMRNRRRTKVLL